MARYLVIGGAGFLGGHLLGELLGRGYDVTVQDVLLDPMAGRLSKYRGRVAYSLKSVIDMKADDVLGFDYVLNLAGLTDVPLAVTSPRWAFEQNLGGALALLEALRDAKGRPRTPKKSLFMSTENIYGDVPPERLPVSEEEPPRPVDAYSASKVAMEAVCHSYARQWRIPIAIVRSSTVFGEWARPRQAIPTFIRQALHNEPITIEGDGSQSRDFAYVANTVDGILRATESNFDFGVWNIGSGRETTIGEVVNIIIKLTKSRSEISHRAWRPGEQGVRLVTSIEKARKELGYEPKVGMEEGLRRTIRWMEESP